MKKLIDSIQNPPLIPPLKNMFDIPCKIAFKGGLVQAFSSSPLAKGN